MLYEILGESTKEIIINKSKFIGYCVYVYDEQNAIALLNARKKQYSNATHNCYAYIIGQNMGTMRYSDDSEPSGTAGVPILDCLAKNKLTNVLAVVTRYFGGILLGSGGLVRAYSRSVSESLSCANIVLPKTLECFSVCVSYSVYAKLEDALNRLEVMINQTDFTHEVVVEIATAPEHTQNILKTIGELSFGLAKITQKGEKIIKIPVSNH